MGEQMLEMNSHQKKLLSEVFDCEWYQEKYPDVGMSGIDPWEHYQLIGMFLNRDVTVHHSTESALQLLPKKENKIPDYEMIRFSIDHPLIGGVNKTGRVMQILGWCFSLNQEDPIESIRIEFDDGRTLNLPVSHCRHDVFRAFGGSETLHSERVGFAQCIKLDDGFHMMSITALSGAAEYPLGKALLHVNKKHARLQNGPHNYKESNDYDFWVEAYGCVSKEQEKQYVAEIEEWENSPLISIVMPVYRCKLDFIKTAIDSVREQIYPNWELCIADDFSDEPALRAFLEVTSQENPKIKVIFREKNGHISEATNSAIGMASGTFLAFMDQDDLLSRDALYYLAKEIRENPRAKLIYSDEDKIDDEGKRITPFFKPDWNPDLLLSMNYICHLLCCERAVVDQVGGLRKGVEGSQDWDLILRITEQLEKHEIAHVHRVLYHWRSHKLSTAQNIDSKDYIGSSSEQVLLDTMQRRGIRGKLEKLPGGHWRMNRSRDDLGVRGTIIIPTRNSADLLKQCIGSILEKTTYRNYEILIIDNESDEQETLDYLAAISLENGIRVLKMPGAFNYSRFNNLAAKEAEGEVIVLLNNDTEVISSDWLSELVAHAIRPEIGCVGGLLLFPNDTIQHAGVLLGLGGVAGHAYKHLDGKTPVHGYLNLIPRNYSAVTAACLAVRKSVFEEVGGLDEENLKVAFNDVDFCIKVREAGYWNLYTPFCRLYHHESVSRGLDESPEKRARFESEVKFMKLKWSKKLEYDPAYNLNYSMDTEQYHYSFPPKTKFAEML